MSLLTQIPPAAVVLAAVLVVPLLSRRTGHAVGAGATLLALVHAVVVPAGVHVPTSLFGFDTVLFAVDPFSRLMGIIFGFIGTVAVLYSWASRAETTQTAYALSYVGTSLGAVFAGDWLTLLFFWELMAVTSTLLVWDYGGRAVRAGFRYALLHGIGGSLLMGAIIWHYVAVGSFRFEAASGLVGTVPAVLAAIGIGVNVGFVGLHAWLPDTYPRPHIAASVFLCVFTTKTGVYGMMRAFPEGHLWIAYMGGGMAVFGAFMALLQSDMRRLLSYHIQSQVGYMIAGVGVGTTLATAGAFGHVFNHILYKSLLFMTVGVVIYRTGYEELERLGGLAREMPITALTFSIAALSIAGFPGFNGFVSKGMVIAAAHHEHLDVLWWLLLVGGVGTFLSFIKLGYYVFFHGSYDGSVRDANRGQQVALVTVAALCVFYGLVPDALYALLPGSAYVAEEYHAFTLGHVGESLALAGVAVVGFVALKAPLKRVGRVPDVDAVYNRLTFYGMRALVRGVTEGYAAVDRVAVGLTRALSRDLRNPEAAVRRIAPGAVGNPDQRYAHPLRADVGTSILLLAVVVALAVFVLVV